jgi:hypothetical protein
MIKKKMYRYLGRNGILTTRILLDGINHIPMVELTAEKGKKLTNGEMFLYQIIVEENEVAEWQEVPDKDN